MPRSGAMRAPACGPTGRDPPDYQPPAAAVDPADQITLGNVANE